MRLVRSSFDFRRLSFGFLIGTASLGMALLAERLNSAATVPEPAILFSEFLLAGLACALGTLPILWNALPREQDTRAGIKRAVYAGALVTTLFLTPTFFFLPEISGLRTVLFYAFVITLNWSVQFFDRRVAPLSVQTVPASLIAAYFDIMPHAPFVVAGLFLLVVTPLALLANQKMAAERLGNWAYGFLLTGATIAFYQSFDLPQRFKEWILRNLQTVFLGYLALVFATAFLIGETTHSSAEGTYIVDVNPNYVAQRFQDGDVLISDSTQLRLRSIPGVGSFLDVQSDESGVTLWDILSRALAGKRRVFWISDGKAGRDRQRILETFLKANGCLDEIPITPLPIRLYELRAPITRPRVFPPPLSQMIVDAFDSVQVDFGAIRIAGARVEARACSHDAVAIAIRWKLAQTPGDPLKVSLRLLDGKGRQIQSQDFFIEDGAQRKTNEWNANAQNDGYYLVTVPLGTAPGNYTIAASVYSEGGGRLRMNSATGAQASFADTLWLGKTEVYRPSDLSADPYKTDQEAALIPLRADARTGLRLNAYGVGGTTILPGETMNLTLRWRAQLDSLPAFQIRTRLVRGDRVIVQASGVPVDNAYPTNLWRAGEFVTDYWDLRVPPETPGGTARVEVEVEGGKTFYLADVNIPDVQHSFQPPAPKNAHRAVFEGVGELVGYDLDRAQIAANGTVALTLDWRAQAPTPLDKNYIVFAQLLSLNGQVIAQSDSAPAQGARPTRGWVNGEFITDTHALNLNDTPFRGDATIVVGLYDPQTLARVPVKDSPDNFTKLPATIRVIAP